MSRFTQCPEARRETQALPAFSTCKLMVALAILLMLALAHIHLRFSLNRTRLETNALQAGRERLHNEIKMLKSQTETLKQPKHLREYAGHELGMIPHNPSSREVIAMPRELHTRYLLARVTSSGFESADAGPDQRTRSPWLELLGGRIGLTGEALAGEPAVEP